MPNPQTCAILLCFDGVVHDSDLPIQAFARHLTELLAPDLNRPMIGGMRGFLEGKPELIPPDVDLSAAEDGDRAVEILACAAGLDDAAIRRARRAARADLATSAWAVDAAEGIDALLAEVQGRASVLLLTEQADPAVSPVLASIDLAVDEIVDLAVDLAIATILQRMALPADRLLMVGTRWAGQLQPAHDLGCATALIDRFDRGRGCPTFRSPDLAGLLGAVREWLTDHATTRTAP